MKAQKNKIYIDKYGEGWVCDCINPLNLTRLRYPNLNWIGNEHQMDGYFIETDIDYTPDFWDKAGLKEIKEYWDKCGKSIKKLKYANDITVRN